MLYHVLVPSAFSGDRLVESSAFVVHRSCVGYSVTCVHGHYGYVEKKGNTSSCPDRPVARRCHDIHAPLIQRISGDMGIPEQPFRSGSVASLVQDLPPRSDAGGVPAVDPASAHARCAVVAFSVKCCSAGSCLALLSVGSNAQPQPSSQEALENWVT